MKKNVSAEIRIKSKVSTIINAFVDPSILKEWWATASVYIEQKDGGLYTLSWLKSDAGIKFILTGRINLLNKRSHLYLEDVLYINAERPILGPTKIKIEVNEKSSYSIVKISHTGFGKTDEWDWYYNLMLDSWPQVLVFLKQYLEKV